MRVLSFIAIGIFCLLWAGVGWGVPLLSGSTALNLSAIPLPCTLVGEIKLDTPCERTVFSWDLDMAIKLRLSLGPGEAWLDATGGFAGFEHVVLGGIYKIPGALELTPELWFAVPFESVTDVNGLPNSAIIPPGRLMFAQARVEAGWRLGDLDVRWVSMFQDLNFPDPGTDFPHLSYPAQSQSFDMGNYVTISGPVVSPVRFSLLIAMGAEPGAYQIKGYSSPGTVVPGRLYARLSFTSIPIVCPYCTAAKLPISDITLGITFQIEPEHDPFLSLSGFINLKVFNTISVATSFTMQIPAGIQWGGFSVSAPTNLGTLNLQFDPQGEFKSGTLNMSYRTDLNLAWASGTFSARLTATSQYGISAASASLFLSQGLFTSNYDLNYAWRSDEGLSFASFSLRFGINLNPLQVGVQLVFGRYGLGRFTIQTGYVF